MATLIARAVNWKQVREAARQGKLNEYLAPEEDTERAEDDLALEDFTEPIAPTFLAPWGCL